MDVRDVLAAGDNELVERLQATHRAVCLPGSRHGGAALTDQQVPDGDVGDEREDAELHQPAERVMGAQGGQPLAAGLHLPKSLCANCRSMDPPRTWWRFNPRNTGIIATRCEGLMHGLRRNCEDEVPRATVGL